MRVPIAHFPYFALCMHFSIGRISINQPNKQNKNLRVKRICGVSPVTLLGGKAAATRNKLAQLDRAYSRMVGLQVLL